MLYVSSRTANMKTLAGKYVHATAYANHPVFIHSISSLTLLLTLCVLQMIVEKAEHGDTDHIKHALDLFVDFAAIFVRVLVIMLQNAEKREDRRDSRKRRG